MSNTHGLIVQFGKHRGERWTRLPVSYLKWLANQADSNAQKIARDELERRGTVLQHEVELSAHAIDRASLRCSKQWKESRRQDEGLYSWLQRMAIEALASAPDGSVELIDHAGIRFVFKHGELFPKLLSVMPTKTVPD